MSRRARRLRWWGSFVLIGLLVSIWSIATPLFAGPDEGVQITKAAAVARFQFLGTPIPWPQPGPSPFIEVHVPAIFATRAPPCFDAGHPNRTAACQPPIAQSSSRLVIASTYVGRYPPLYYLITGLPSLVFTNTLGIRLMRLVSAILAALFLASAFESAFTCRRRPHLVLGVALSATPVALYLASTVNPNGLEIASAISLWSAGVCLALDNAPRVDRRLLVRASIAGMVLVQCRGLSLLWAALICLSLVVFAPRSTLAVILRDRVAQIGIALAGLSSVASLWWLMHFDSLALTPIGRKLHGHFLVRLGTTLSRTPRFLHEMVGDLEVIGNLGTIGAQTPLLTFVAWSVPGIVLLGFAIAAGSKRAKVVLSALIVASIIIPAALEAYVAPRLGLIWYGRYTLPLAAGIAVLAVGAIPVETLPRRYWRFIALGLPALLAIGEADLFLGALRRYTVGYAGSFLPFGGPWNPPLGAPIVLASFLLVLIGFVAWLSYFTWPRETIGTE